MPSEPLSSSHLCTLGPARASMPGAQGNRLETGHRAHTAPFSEVGLGRGGQPISEGH